MIKINSPVNNKGITNHDLFLSDTRKGFIETAKTTAIDITNHQRASHRIPRNA